MPIQSGLVSTYNKILFPWAETMVYVLTKLLSIILPRISPKTTGVLGIPSLASRTPKMPMPMATITSYTELFTLYAPIREHISTTGMICRIFSLRMDAKTGMPKTPIATMITAARNIPNIKV